MEGSLRKKSRGNDASETQTEDSMKSTDQYLTYDVLRIIFKYLNGMELSNASIVCRSWLEAAINEKRTRGPVCLIENCTELIGNQTYSMKDLIAQIIKKLRIKPALGLFVTAPVMPFNQEDCHCKILPTNCNTVTLSTYGAIMNNKEIEENTENIVCTFLPEIPDVTIKTFTINRCSPANCVEKCVKEIANAFDGPETNGNKSMCLLLFSNIEGCSLAKQIVYMLKQCYITDQLPVWGGIVLGLLVSNSEDKKSHQCGDPAYCVAVTLTGSFDSWSVIVDKNCRTSKRVEQKLKSFKNHVTLKKHSVGFMFACCERGTNMFRENDVESTIFKKLFPNVPLVGCFGDGEYGENTIPTDSSNKKPRWYNEMTTVFLIITYG